MSRVTGNSEGVRAALSWITRRARESEACQHENAEITMGSLPLPKTKGGAGLLADFLSSIKKMSSTYLS